MKYKIIQPPFKLNFRKMSKKELKDYYNWFMDIMPERIKELTNAVRQTRGFEAWQPDFSPASLEPLGEWVVGQIETRPRTEEELREIKSKLTFHIEISSRELTNKTFSLAFDVGMYLCQVFLHNNPSLRWDQKFDNRKYIDYGQPVLVEFRGSPLEPVRMVLVMAYGVVRKRTGGRHLRELYDIWEKDIVVPPKSPGNNKGN